MQTHPSDYYSIWQWASASGMRGSSWEPQMGCPSSVSPRPAGLLWSRGVACSGNTMVWRGGVPGIWRGG